MIFQNSEIQRYYWQSFSLQRIIAMPVVLLAIVALILLSVKHDPSVVISYYAGSAYYIIIFLWGGYQAAHALVQEVKENTWDNQRLSSVSPWDLTIGKLLGSTLYSWYGGLILLAIYFFSTIHNAPLLLVLCNLSVMVGAGLLCHSLALFSSLIPLRMQAGRDQFHVAGYYILSLIVSGYFLTMGNSIFTQHHYEHGMKWFGMSISDERFFLGCLLLALFWIFWAIYRFMREALQFKNTPTVWAIFVIFCMIYFAGFGSQDFLPWHRAHDLPLTFFSNGTLFCAFMVGLICSYFSFFSENLNIIHYRTLFHHWQNHSWKKLVHLVPMWSVSLFLSVLVGLFSLVFSVLILDNPEKVIALIVSSVLFALRDACIFHYFTLSPNGRLPHLAALFYLGVLYLLLPNLFFAFGLKFEDAGGVFYPIIQFSAQSSLFKLLPIMLELFVAVVVLKRRYSIINNKIEK